MVLTGNLKHPDMCWKDNRAEHKQPRKLLECSDNNFLTQVIKERCTARPNTYKLGRTGHGTLKSGQFGCNDDEMMEFRILRGGSKVKSKTTLDVRTGDYNLFRDLLGKIPWDTNLERRRSQ